jgi:hypothetical protein
VFVLPERLSSSCCRSAFVVFLLLAAGALDHPNNDRRRRVCATGAHVVFLLPERLSSSCCLLPERLIIRTTIGGSRTGATAGRGRVGEQWAHSRRSAAQHCYEEIARPTQLVKTLSSKSCWASLQSAGRRDFDCSIDDVCRLPRREFVLTCAVLFGRSSTCSGTNSTECYRICI